LIPFENSHSPPPPLHSIAFAGMFIYVPLATVTDILFQQTGSKTWGNVVVWCSLLIGQPIGIILYAKEFQRAAAEMVLLSTDSSV
jgi:hypothetical protein